MSSTDHASGAAAALAISARLSVLADGLDAAAAALPNGGPGWHGPAADALAGLLATRPERFRAGAAACRSAAAALAGYADALGPAVLLARQSEQVPVELAAALGRRADGLADESARRASGTLLALAASVPSGGDLQDRWLRRMDVHRSELQLGAAEATQGLLSTAAQLAVRVLDPFGRRGADDAARVRAGVIETARNPVAFAKSLVDWDTWRANPSRAVGHLVPDLLAAVASGGTATAAKAATAAGRTREAVRVAALRDSMRREASGAAAAASRQALVRRAQSEALARIERGPSTADRSRGSLPGWSGPGGTRLTPLQNASTEVFHALSAGHEPAVTTAVRAAAPAGRGRLVGLDHRLKLPDSYKRKLASASATTGRPLPELLARAEDAVRYTAVIDDANYVRGVAEIAAALERQGFHARSVHNAWHGPRYRGINSTWLDPATGAAFEVQFHTPASWRITRRTHGMYEEYRLPGISGERKAELHELIAGEYRKAPVPGWVQTLTPDTFPPPGRPDPIVPPVDYTVHAAAAGAAGAHVGVATSRPPP